MKGIGRWTARNQRSESRSVVARQAPNGTLSATRDEDEDGDVQFGHRWFRGIPRTV